MGESYDQKDAAGFIRILGLPSRSQAQIRAKRQKASASEAKDSPNAAGKNQEAEVIR
jgi:hypothetical protein